MKDETENHITNFLLILYFSLRGKVLQNLMQVHTSLSVEKNEYLIWIKSSFVENKHFLVICMARHAQSTFHVFSLNTPNLSDYHRSYLALHTVGPFLQNVCHNRSQDQLYRKLPQENRTQMEFQRDYEGCVIQLL